MADKQSDLPIRTQHLRNARRWSSGGQRRPKSSTVNTCSAELGVAGESLRLQCHTSKTRHIKAKSCTPAPVYGFLDDNTRPFTSTKPLYPAWHRSTSASATVEMKTLQGYRCSSDTRASKVQTKMQHNPPKRNDNPAKDVNVYGIRSSILPNPASLVHGNENSTTDIQDNREALLTSQQDHLNNCKKQVKACQEDLSQYVPPCSKWYELKSPEFHLEAGRHVQLVKKSLRWKKSLEDSGNFLHQLDSLLVLGSSSSCNANTAVRRN